MFVFTLMSTRSYRTDALAQSYTHAQIVKIVNDKRVEEGLSQLNVNYELSEAAQNKASDMADKSYFSHISAIDGKKWSDFIKDENYKYEVAGENLANGFSEVDPMVEAWMLSPSHRENILNSRYQETGVGIAVGNLDGYTTVFVVQMFGKPSSSTLL